ncbi:MAG: hypothetical protein WCC94_05475 [Candidatus Bathyarchaeia archaeon]
MEPQERVRKTLVGSFRAFVRQPQKKTSANWVQSKINEALRWLSHEQVRSLIVSVQPTDDIQSQIRYAQLQKMLDNLSQQATVR